MHHAEKDVPRLVVLLLDILLHHLREGLVARLVALDDFASLFVDDDDVVVLVDDLHVAYMFMPPSTWMTWPET